MEQNEEVNMSSDDRVTDSASSSMANLQENFNQQQVILLNLPSIPKQSKFNCFSFDRQKYPH